MPRVAFFTPGTDEVPNPSESFLCDLLRNVDMNYWRRGECDVALRAFDEEDKTTAELYIYLKPPNRFRVIYPRRNQRRLALSSYPKDDRIVEIFDGQEYQNIPTFNLCNAEAALQACLHFCRTFGGRDPNGYWLPSQALDPDADPSFLTADDWDKERVF